MVNPIWSIGRHKRYHDVRYGTVPETVADLGVGFGIVNLTKDQVIKVFDPTEFLGEGVLENCVGVWAEALA